MSTQKTMNTGKLDNTASTSSGPGYGFILSRNPTKAMQEMMETIDALRSLYTEENEALLASSSTRFMALQDRKIEVTSNYKSAATQMIERREEFKAIDPSLREKISKAHDDFSNLAATNLAALSRMRKNVQRLSHKIMTVAREAAQKDTVNYGASGHLNKNQRAVSIGISESA